MKINWTVRFKNKTWLITFLVTICTFVYQLFGLFGVVPSISEDQITTLITLVINMVASLGIIVDPTTAGVNDSEQALIYTEPKATKR